MQSHHLHHRVELVHGMTYILDGQILRYIEHVERKGFSRPTWYGNLDGNQLQKHIYILQSGISSDLHEYYICSSMISATCATD